ncbi:MAG TPA: hypothetical protein VLW50_17895 [Streptosporangiaceae bacterium]|nr:hypothetical protein [Streptosporangiaceae bacterium]
MLCRSAECPVRRPNGSAAYDADIPSSSSSSSAAGHLIAHTARVAFASGADLGLLTAAAIVLAD